MSGWGLAAVMITKLCSDGANGFEVELSAEKRCFISPYDLRPSFPVSTTVVSVFQAGRMVES